MKGRSPLHVLTAYGFGNPWFVWSFARGQFDEWCKVCGGRGVLITSPCDMRDAPLPAMRCTPADGCARCRRKCTACHGARITSDVPVMTEDFGDFSDLLLAQRIFPKVPIDEDPHHRRMVMPR